MYLKKVFRALICCHFFYPTEPYRPPLNLQCSNYFVAQISVLADNNLQVTEKTSRQGLLSLLPGNQVVHSGLSQGNAETIVFFCLFVCFGVFCFYFREEVADSLCSQDSQKYKHTDIQTYSKEHQVKHCRRWLSYGGTLSKSCAGFMTLRILLGKGCANCTMQNESFL